METTAMLLLMFVMEPLLLLLLLTQLLLLLLLFSPVYTSIHLSSVFLIGGWIHSKSGQFQSSWLCVAARSNWINSKVGQLQHGSSPSNSSNLMLLGGGVGLLLLVRCRVEWIHRGDFPWRHSSLHDFVQYLVDQLRYEDAGGILVAGLFKCLQGRGCQTFTAGVQGCQASVGEGER